MNGENQTGSGLERYLSPIHVWALSFGCAVGWGAFVMPGTTFLPAAGPLGTALGIILGAVVMFIIGVNYYYLMNKFRDAGGTLTYTVRTFGYDHGFMSAWFLILVYIAIIWANASALGLISKNLFGSTFQFGFYYRILGYDVYFGEVLLSLLAIIICGTICIKGKKLASALQILFAVVLISAIIICTVAINMKSSTPNIIPEPLFSSKGGNPLRQLFTIIALSPWAYVGFESVSNSAAGFKFSSKKILPILLISLLTSAASYVLLSQMAIAMIPDGYSGWESYIGDIGNHKGIEGLPTFYAAHSAMGKAGVVILGLSALAGIVTGLIGNFIAASRLLYAMAGDGMLPDWFGELTDNKTPANALKFLMGISLVIPFLGRTAIGWIVDVNTIGATIAYAYTSATAFVNAKKDGKKVYQVTGVIGLFLSLLFFLYFMVLAAEAMSTESYLILAAWSILGFLYFRHIFAKDDKKRFGKSTIVWITLLFLIYFTSLLWVKRATDDVMFDAIDNISEFYEEQNLDRDSVTVRATEEYMSRQISLVDRKLTRNSIIQMSLNVVSLVIMFSIYSIMSKRERKAQYETIKADERSRAKTVFLSNMSHDIRTPMNAIIGYINLAEDENVTFEQLKDYLQKIKGSSKHLLALINDVLEMSRIESGKMEVELSPANIKGMMGELRDLFATQMSEKKINYIVNADDVRDEYVLCDKNRLNRVLLNLVSNAYKFTPEGGTVKVITRQMTGLKDNKAEYEIRVSDSGIGMSKEFAAKVFDAFEREKTDEVSHIQGTGLGMSIVKSIVELMGGNIAVNTEKGKGTEFVVTIWFALQSKEEIEKAGEKEQVKKEASKTVDFTTKRLLLADDIMVNRQIAAKLLERSGFKVESAENGLDAVNKLKDSEDGYFDAVLMDIQMPEMNGYEATQAIRALPDEKKSNIPVIAMTANAFAEDVKKAKDAGMNAHVAKPIDVKNLMDVLTEVLSQ
ncbi:MAG: amino acid permease [Butyrivibrio sp.]|nr:amino acid permease [Butyrivibrio sp.]